ncbi:ABC transporter substrate-binding protein [Pseudoalteromonas denitrificans]|uniref:Putative ABC transport system substrate-binding protein n=1 Tax=Pseudoalteromonas denitrificans DSM 6059 TaxID=1123010 RepID=A0A1I1TW57_9GAMM|nr:ABC transporter substrate-binding protein [Pseudoalteromonas denitrificans]SFD62861.1 putative ABC transport system substrate-binding protein [Pseudoalteromonas denitrificans DSM 6059]
MNVKMKGIYFLILSLLTFSMSVMASEYKIGLSAWSGYPQSIKGFKDALAKGGFIEGKNTLFILKNANANRQKQIEIAQKFEDENLDLIYSLTTPSTVIIKDIVKPTTPIVFSIVTYPADSGLIESFDYSGNNLVGTSNYVPLKYYVDLFIKLLPEAKKVAIFHRKGEPNSNIQAVNLSRLFRRNKIDVLDQQPENLAEVRQMAQALEGKVDAIITTTDTLMQNGGEQALVLISKAHGIPILSSNKQGIINGSTFGPVADFYTLGKMSGEMAIKILNGDSTPKKLKSKLQNPPTILVNKSSIDLLKIKIPASLTSIVYVD